VNWSAWVFLVKVLHLFSSLYCNADTSSPIVTWLGVSSEVSGISFYTNGVAHTLCLQLLGGCVFPVVAVAFPFVFVVLHT
jgi:hypothetical protein